MNPQHYIRPDDSQRFRTEDPKVWKPHGCMRACVANPRPLVRAYNMHVEGVGVTLGVSMNVLNLNTRTIARLPEVKCASGVWLGRQISPRAAWAVSAPTLCSNCSAAIEDT